MKSVAEPEIDLQDDPRAIKDPVVWNRMRLLHYHEAAHEAWGCALYAMHRKKLITDDQKRAGDAYWTIVENHKRWQATDPDEAGQGSEMAYRRVKRAKEKYEDCRHTLGLGKKVIDELIFEELWPATEASKKMVRDGIQLLANLFATGNKTRTKKPQNVV